MARQDQLSRWADIAKIAAAIIALATLVLGGGFVYNEVWHVSDLTYTILPTYDMKTTAFSGLVVENRGRVPARDIDIILVDLEHDIQDLQMPGPHEEANTTWNPNNPTNMVTIKMARLSPGAALSIYLRTSGPVTLAEGETFTIVSDRGKARVSASAELPSFWIGIIVAGVIGLLAFRLGTWLDEVSKMREIHAQWILTALAWVANGRRDSLRRANLQGADLRGVDLGPGEAGGRGADLSYSNLKRADLRSAILGGANLTGANLTGVNLTGANLRDANLWGADLMGADLMGADLTGARYDPKTRWPDGFTPPPEAVKVEVEAPK